MDPLLFSVAWHGWEMQQHREPGGALNQRPDRGTPKSQDQVTFPVSWHCPVVGLGGALADHDLGADERAAPCRVRARGTRKARPVRVDTPQGPVLARLGLAHKAAW